MYLPLGNCKSAASSSVKSVFTFAILDMSCLILNIFMYKQEAIKHNNKIRLCIDETTYYRPNCNLFCQYS